jgi:sugar (pentulose or hexulose) kinase
VSSVATPRRVLVLDIGKTNAKAVLIDAAAFAEIDVLRMPNRPLPGPPYPHADTDGLWSFMLGAARELHARHGVEALVATTHGATAALLDAGGALALPLLDYEHDGPDELARDYDAARPDFAESGSPRLPAGLNLGAQLFWQFRRFPREAARAAAIVTYPQYWAFRLSGVAANEPTSLGAHTDLWNPHPRRFSSLVEAEGWLPRMAPLRRAADRLGRITAEVAAATGLDPETPVFCGIHDSNASLLPHLAARTPPFAVVSTGTWVIAMAIGGRAVALDPRRDTLVNVDAFGDPVPSARFMGGREWSRLMDGRHPAATPADAERVRSRAVMLYPAVESGSGPFAGRAHRWSVPESELTDAERAVAASYYLALMTGTCLEMIGADGPVCLEGPFAANRDFAAMLAAATGRPVLAGSGSGTGTSAGATLLCLPESATPPAMHDEHVELTGDERRVLSAYAERWREAVPRPGKPPDPGA